MRNQRPSRKRMVHFVIVVGGAACVGSIALGKTVQLAKQETADSIATTSKLGLSSEIRKANGICRTNPAPGAWSTPSGCLDGGGARYALGHSPCWRYNGRCTSHGAPQCVTGPSAQSPDATTVTQCCTSASQYPWINVCPAQPVAQGCSFCVF
jgi:hypothetical protein